MSYAMASITQLHRLLSHPEGINLEFKSARFQFSRERDLPNYCAALANEGGGKLLLGVNDRGIVVGTKAFAGTHQRLSHDLLQRLGLRVDVEEVIHPVGRVLIFHIPSHYPGKPVKSNDVYWMRAGESLVPMDEQTLFRLLSAGQPDYTARAIAGVTLADLDLHTIAILRKLCFEKSKNSNYKTSSDEQFLQDLGLATAQDISYAGIILMGTQATLRQHIPHAEIIFEWRQIPGKTNYDFRQSWQAPFLQIVETIWDEIDKRNLITPYREGFIQREIKAFDRDSIREAILNAVAHRDYQRFGEVIFIYGSPDGITMESPGGFLPGITAENAIQKHAWRNPLLAQTFEKAGLVERAGQGLDLIYEQCIREGKGTPDFSQSDDYHVRLFVPAQVRDTQFVLFLENLANEKQIHLSFEELYELERIRQQQTLRQPRFKEKFIALRIIEPLGRGRGTKYLLSHRYYEQSGKAGVYTRLKGLSRGKYKELILTHLRRNKKGYKKDVRTALSELKPQDVSNLLQELKREGKIIYYGHTSQAGYWQIANKSL